MKHKRLKNYLKLGILLFGVLITATNCDKDDTISNQVPVLSNSTKFKLQRITNPPVSQNKELSETLSSFKSKSNHSDLDYQAREVYNAELDFTIDTDISNYIEYGAYHSYTFPITRIEDNGLVENLLLSLQIDGTYKAYLVTYDLTEDEKLQIQNNENIDLSDKTTFTTLQDQEWASSLFARIGDNGICHEWITITPRCTFDGEHSAEDRETGNNGGFQCAANFVAEPYTISSFTECPESGGGSGFNPTDPTGPIYDDYGNPYGNVGGGDGTSSGNSGLPDTDNPNDNDGDTQDENTDCLQPDANGNCGGDMTGIIIAPEESPEGKLKRITDKANIKSKIIELKNKCTNPTQITEDGAQYIKVGRNYSERLPNYRGATQTRWDPDFVTDVEVVVHMHPIKAYDYTVAPPVLRNIAPVFSTGDIVAFLGMGEFSGFSNDNITAILISPAGGFAMRIDDEDKMQAALTLLEPIGYDDNGYPIDSPDMVKLKQDYNEKVIKPCGDTDNACFKEKFKTFINTFTLSNGDGLGISYYEATFDTNDNITDWEQQ